MKKVSLAGFATQTPASKSAKAYPLLPDPDGQVAEIVTSILDKSAQVEAIEGALELEKAELIAIAKPFYFTRLKRAYSAKAFAQVRWKLSVLREQGADDEAEAYRESFLRRMWDVGFFMKALKQRFSAWFNRQRGRKGTLWEERYRSVLVESGEALAAMACYIDLNPVRAAIVEDTQDYRWCGYAQAMAGRQNARRALAEVTAGRLASLGDRAARTQAQHLAEYRVWLYGAGEEKRQTEQGRVIRRGFQREKVAEVLASGGKLDWWQLLRCRVRYFNDGAVLGTREFVNRIFQHERHRFGPNRKTGARPLRGVEANGLCALRDLRVEVLG